VALSPIECEQALKRIELYLDGELAGLERSEVERHIGECTDCYGHSEFQRRLKDMLRETCGCKDVPQALVVRLQRLVAERGERSLDV
jgi:mycothiol system anti-sigma-R factor